MYLDLLVQAFIQDPHLMVLHIVSILERFVLNPNSNLDCKFWLKHKEDLLLTFNKINGLHPLDNDCRNDLLVGISQLECIH